MEPSACSSKKDDTCYVEKSLGSTQFYKCEACPYMALAEGDIKYHLFTAHYDLAKSNGLADQVKIPCPGCASVFETEDTLRTHLKTYHKMGMRDIKKMTKSLILIALSSQSVQRPVDKPSDTREQDIKPQPFIEIDVQCDVEVNVEGQLHEFQPQVIEEEDTKAEPELNIDEERCKLPSNTKQNQQKNYIPLPNNAPDLIASVCSTLNQQLSRNNSECVEIEVPNTNICSSSQLINESGNSIENKSKKSCVFPNCKAAFFSENNLAYHLKCHSKTSLICPECDTKFLKLDKLHNHLWTKHGLDMELSSCTECNYKTFHIYRLTNVHMKTHSKVKKFKCSTCFKSFKSQKQMTNHMAIHRPKIMKMCPFCKVEYDSRRFNEHIAVVHKDARPFVCNQCGYKTAFKYRLASHIRSHTGEKTFNCNICSFKAGDHNSLRRHKKIHFRETLYKCKYCNYTCIQAHLLKKHIIRMHPENKHNDIFFCLSCKYTTINKKQYEGHIRKHVDEKNSMKCTIDDFPNNVLNEATDLEQAIDNESPLLSCCFCKYSTRIKKIFDSHICKHFNNIPSDTVNIDYAETYEERFACAFCNFECVGIKEFEAHMNTHVALPANDMQASTPTSSESQSPARNFSPFGSTQQNKVVGTIKSVQILPSPAASKSPLTHVLIDNDTLPRKKPKISVKSNLILKGPDEMNIFHSQQKMAFEQMEDREHGIDLDSPVITFNNLINTQFIAPVIQTSNDNPLSSILTFNPQSIMSDSDAEANQTEIQDNQNLITFSRPLDVTSFNNMLTQSAISSNSNYAIKFETNRNIQSPNMDIMGNTMFSNTNILNDYCKTSPSLEELSKNMGDIKNELKSDFFSVPALRNNNQSSLIVDPSLLENIGPNELYTTQNHENIPDVVLTELAVNQEYEVIEIDDNSEDHKMLDRYDNISMDSYYQHDYHFLENDMSMGLSNILNENLTDTLNRINDPSTLQNKVDFTQGNTSGSDFQIYLSKEPALNTTNRTPMNKINVKNIELMKNIDPHSSKKSE